MKNILKPLARSVLKNSWLSNHMEDIRKIVKSFKESFFLTDGVSETIEKKSKKQKGGFLGMLIGTVGASLLGNLLAGKEVIRAGEGTIRADLEF